MSFRAIYIVHAKPVKDKTKQVAFKRVFPVIEKKCQKKLGVDKYRKIPADFPSLILEELQLLRNIDEFLPKFDSCAKEITHPVYKMLDGSLYPVVAFKETHFVYCCIVWDGNDDFAKPKLFIESPGVIFALNILENMAKFVGKDNDTEGVMSESKLESLHRYISVGLPFGVPADLDINTVLAMASTADGAVLPKTKGPSWRPVAYKGKQTLNIAISEFVRALQFDHDEYPDKFEVYGTVTCKAEVEESPEISLNFFAPLDCNVLHNLAYHPTVQYVDDLPVMQSDNSKSGISVEYETQKLRFCPPYDEFVLFHYKADLSEIDIPVKAFYQMKGDSRKVNIMIQLSLADTLRNDFEAFEIRIPFYNRGPILDVTCTASSMNIGVLPDKATLLWNIGSKFPNRSCEASLEVVVTFADSSKGVVRSHPYLHELNAYILVSWKMIDFTYSGLKFDTKSVELSPSSKIKVSATSTFKTVEYKVWNSHGDITDATFSQ